METFTIEHLTFYYPNKELPTLDNISLSISQGDFVAICGKSGCGKSTLLRQLKTVLTPHGEKNGNIFFEGMPLDEVDQRTQASKIGYVLQSPDNQIVTDKVWHELAFGLESLGLDTTTIRVRVAEMASFFGIQTWFHKNVDELSGGQKQLLNLAAIMAMQPSVLILDEPTSQLDPIAAKDFLETIKKINQDLGTTIIISEHRLDEVFPMSDKVVVIDEGKIIACDKPQLVGEKLKTMKHDMFLAMPTPMRIYANVENDLKCPITVREGRAWLDELSVIKQISFDTTLKDNEYKPLGQPLISLKDIWFRYEKSGDDIVKNLSMNIYNGEFYAIVGGNGAGKTTTLSLICGINKPYRGKVSIENRQIHKIPNNELFGTLLGVLPQNPQSLFVKNTVELDLYEMFSDKNISKQEKSFNIQEIAKLCDIENLFSMHPYDLSGGEQQRVALAKILLLNPKILLLDEPTKGLDSHFKIKFAHILKELQNNGTTIVMVSHDVEFCAEYADRCAMFFDGSIVTEDTPKKFFSGNSFYTTAANRMARHKLPSAITAEDVIKACGGDIKNIPTKPPKIVEQTKKPIEKTHIKNKPQKHTKLSKRMLMATLMILLAIPLTILFGVYFLDDRKYYFISLLVILETMLPFLMIFESRKPQARELVVIAVLCGIGVVGRMAFFMVPQFKPVVAIVIIAGVCLGGEAGFLVGAMTGFVSNFFFGQGPHTPWQMFAFGIIGFLSGILFNKNLLNTKKIQLCIFGVLATFFIYGVIMNTSSVIMFQPRPTKEMFLLSYIQGFPFDLVHSISTVIFLFLLAKPMIEKLDRIKIKYGLIQ